MKKQNVKLIAAICILSSVLWGCGLGKMVKKYPEVKYEVQPQVLETNGGKINVTVTGTIPAKYFHKKAVVDFTPVIKYNGGEYALKTLNLQGEKAVGNGTVINKKTGGSFSYSDVIPYKPEMNSSNLVVNIKATLAKKDVFLGERKLADGVIYTSERAVSDEKVIMATRENVKDMPFFEKEVPMTKTADIYFAYQKANIDMKLAGNKKAENIQALNDLKAFALNNWTKKSLLLNAWASPEGEERFNADLSSNRAKAAEKFFREQIAADYKKATKLKYADSLKFVATAKGEDWEGFVKAVGQSEIKDKNTILNVVNSQADVAKREQEIKNMTIVYKEIENEILPSLRRAEISITGLVPAKTDAQIAEFAKNNPDSLNLVEALYAGELTQDLNQQLAIYKNIITRFPKDWRAYNNAGAIMIKLNQFDEAQSVLEQGNTVTPNKGMILNNLGVVAARKKDLAAAKSYFESAQANGQDCGYNVGIIYIREGNYSGAISSFGATTCNYNLALAQLLNKDNAAATSTLECAPKTAESYYLMAVIGARTNNAGMIAENLRNAISADPKYREQAKEDREFMKFFNNSQFQDAIK